MSEVRTLSRALLLWLIGTAIATAATPLADPMRPPQAAASTVTKKATVASDSGLHLSAIRITREQRSARINGRIVAPGETIAGARVVAIEANRVILAIDGRQQTLSLLPVRIKKPLEATQE